MEIKLNTKLPALCKSFFEFGLPQHNLINDFLSEILGKDKIKVYPTFESLIIFDLNISCKDILFAKQSVLLYLLFFFEKFTKCYEDIDIEEPFTVLSRIVEAQDYQEIESTIHKKIPDILDRQKQLFSLILREQNYISKF